MLKPIVSGMSDAVRAGVSKLRTLSAPAREIARWYEDYPGQIYLPKGTEHLRANRYLRFDDVEQIVGVKDGLNWCRTWKLKPQLVDGKPAILFSDLQRFMLSLLPPGFPIVSGAIGLRYSDALIAIRKNELHSQRCTWLCMFGSVDTNTINNAFGREKGNTIFDRHGFSEPDGSKIRVTTHQFRHYLNTIAQSSGLSQLDIAKWSGRLDVRQNAAYDHVSTSEMLVQIRAAVGDGAHMLGPLGAAPDRRLISRDEFAQLKVPTAHATELGFCVHDFTMSPCELHRDCINCNELVCIKGDCSRNAAARLQLEQTRTLLERAEQAQGEGYYGADRWAVHHRVTADRLEQLCAIFDAPSIPDGTFVTMKRPSSTAEPRLARRTDLIGHGPKLLAGDAS